MRLCYDAIMMTKITFNWPDKSSLSRGAVSIVNKLRGEGYSSYIAGGAVRDALLKRPINEIDIATSAMPAEVKKIYQKVIPTGEKHGTVTVRLGKQSYEVTTFRRESDYHANRWPKKVKFVSSAELDAKRRDFTINALFYDPESKEIIDFAEGIVDLKKSHINLVGDPEERIQEDSLRMLRAVRFATTLNFHLSHETIRAIKKNASSIKKISAERIKQELDKIMMSAKPSLGVGLLDVVGLLEYILPELWKTRGVSQPKNEHSEGDVYAHTLLALEKIDESYDLQTRYAILFHDIGKPQTRAIRSGKVTFYNHTVIGAELSAKVCQRLKFSKADTEKICWLVRAHLVPNDLRGMKLATRRKWGLSPYFEHLLRLYKSDVAASLRPSGKAEANPAGYKIGLGILKEIRDVPQLKKPLLGGEEIMRILKIKEGPLVGKILSMLEQKKLSGEVTNRIEAEKFLRSQKKILDKKLSTP